MKKLLVMLLVALLVFPTALLASDVEYATYSTADYSIEYPTDWQVLDRDTIDQVIGMVTSGEIEGMDTSMLSQYKAQIEATNMTVIMSTDGSINFNVIGQDMGMSMDVDTLISALAPTMITQYESMFPGFEVLDAGSSYTAGDNTYAMIAGQYELQGVSMIITQLMYPHDNELSIITFTVLSDMVNDVEATDAILDQIAASFTVL